MHSGDLALAISRFYLAHEVHHLEKHWKGVALLQLLSSLTLVSRNFSTLSLDLAQYERDADREAVKKSGGEGAIKGLEFLEVWALQWGVQRPRLALGAFFWERDVIGYLHPPPEERKKALQEISHLHPGGRNGN